jgi:hypothetical protein
VSLATKTLPLDIFLTAFSHKEGFFDTSQEVERKGMRKTIAALCDDSIWTPWQPLEKSWLGSRLPTHPGLYRIRLVEEENGRMAYIGQSGRSLKERIAALRSIYSDRMPYKAPHTAGPALWAWRQVIPHAPLEVSVAPLPELPLVLRLGLECLALARYRQHGHGSPLCQFGRMPTGYAPSSGNDARLVVAGKRIRGGATSLQLDCHLPGIAPAGPLTGDPHARDWCGHQWSPWIPLRTLRPVGEEGLYRLCIPDLDPLVFLGQGKLAERLKHLPLAEQVACSWVSNSRWSVHQRLELVTDMIGAHLLTTATIPLWQFEPEHGPGGETPRQEVS